MSLQSKENTLIIYQKDCIGICRCNPEEVVSSSFEGEFNYTCPHCKSTFKIWREVNRRPIKKKEEKVVTLAKKPRSRGGIQNPVEVKKEKKTSNKEEPQLRFMAANLKWIEAAKKKR